MFHFLTIILRTATIYFTTNFLFCHMAIFIFYCIFFIHICIFHTHLLTNAWHYKKKSLHRYSDLSVKRLLFIKTIFNIQILSMGNSSFFGCYLLNKRMIMFLFLCIRIPTLRILPYSLPGISQFLHLLTGDVSSVQ